MGVLPVVESTYVVVQVVGGLAAVYAWLVLFEKLGPSVR